MTAIAPVDTSSFTPDQLSAFQNAAALGSGVPTYNSTSTTTQGPVIPVASTNTSSQPFTTSNPPTDNASGTLSNASSIAQQLIDGYTAQAKADTASATSEQNDLLSGLKGMYDTLGTKSSVQQQLEQASVDPLKEQLASLNKNLMSTQAQAFQASNNSENRQAPMFAITGEQAQIQRQLAVQTYSQAAAISAVNGELSNAQDYVTKAVAAQFDPIEQRIQYQQQLLQLNQSKMTNAQKEKADAFSAQLQQAQNQVAQQKQDMQTGQALAIAAMKMNPNNPAALYAAQQALKLDPSSPTYIQDVANLVAKYQQDPIATQTAIYQMQKARNDAVASQPLSPNDPSAVAVLDPGSKSILSQTGLSVAAFNYLTKGTAALSRLSATDRKNIMAEASNYLNKTGTDYATFQSQYAAYTDVLQKNISRANQTSIFAGEVSGTVDQFVNDIGANFGKLKASNIVQLFAGQQVNDPMVQKYAFDLQTMRNDLAGYYAASRGTSQPDNADLISAQNVILSGINAGSAKAFQQAITANETKVNGVVAGAVDSTQKQVWDLFGVGNKYQSSTASAATITVVDPSGQVGTIPKSQLAEAFKAGYKLPAAPMDHL